MTDRLHYRRKRLRFRAWHRGTKEADLILGPFADRHLDGFGEADIEGFEALLDRPDPEIMALVTGAAEPPAGDPIAARLVESIRSGR